MVLNLKTIKGFAAGAANPFLYQLFFPYSYGIMQPWKAKIQTTEEIGKTKKRNRIRYYVL
jgi:hypothetical protein